MEVMPFGEVVQYQLPEVAKDRHQALEARWAKGVWLGHARHSCDAIIATETGIVKAWSIRRMTEEQREDGERLRNIKGSPTN